MGICPNCGSWVDEGDICQNCGGVGVAGNGYSESAIKSLAFIAQQRREGGDLKSALKIYKDILRDFDSQGPQISYDSFRDFHEKEAKEAIQELEEALKFHDGANYASEKIEPAQKFLPEDNDDDDIYNLNCQKRPIEYCIDNEIGFQNTIEELKKYGKDILFTIAGTEFYETGEETYKRGLSLKLVKEPENEFDSDAIAVYAHDKKIGYVANSGNTTHELTSSASELQDKIGDVAFGNFIGYLSRDGVWGYYYIGKLNHHGDKML